MVYFCSVAAFPSEVITLLEEIECKYSQYRSQILVGQLLVSPCSVGGGDLLLLVSYPMISRSRIDPSLSTDANNSLACMNMNTYRMIIPRRAESRCTVRYARTEVSRLVWDFGPAR